jgi:hypothetical protein
MKTTYILAITAVVVLIALAAILSSGGFGRKQTAKTVQTGLGEWQMRYQDDLRGWLQSLSPQDANTLANSRRVEWNYAQVKAYEPAHAALVDSYLADCKVELAKEGLDLPASRFENPQTVSFKIQPNGSYCLQIICEPGHPVSLLLVK